MSGSAGEIPAEPVVPLSDSYRVPRGRDHQGLLRRPGDADPEGHYACPACSTALRLKRSPNGHRYFAHTQTEQSCNDETIQEQSAIAQLGDLLSEVLAGRLALTLVVPCPACGKPFRLQLAGDAAWDERAAAEHGIVCRGALLRDGAVRWAFRFPVDAEPAPNDGVTWVVVSPREFNGPAAAAALLIAAGGSFASLELKAEAWSGTQTCGACQTAVAQKRHETEERERSITNKLAAVAALAADVFTREDTLRLTTSPCPVCGHRRGVTVRRGHYDQVVRPFRDADGQEWDVALIRNGELALGVLIVHGDALNCQAKLDRALATKSKWIAIPAIGGDGADGHGILQDETPVVITCNQAYLLTDGDCSYCAAAAAAASIAAARQRDQEQATKAASIRRDGQDRLRQLQEIQRRAGEREAAAEEERERNPDYRIDKTKRILLGRIASITPLSELARLLITGVRDLRSTVAGIVPPPAMFLRAVMEIRSAAQERRRQLYLDDIAAAKLRLATELKAATTLTALEQCVAERVVGCRQEISRALFKSGSRDAIDQAAKICDGIAAAAGDDLRRARVLVEWKKLVGLVRLAGSSKQVSLPEFSALGGLDLLGATYLRVMPSWLQELLTQWRGMKPGRSEEAFCTRLREMAERHPEG